MDRRTYLALAGTAFSSGIAGCGGGSDDGSGAEEDTSGGPVTGSGTVETGDRPGTTETQPEEDGATDTAAPGLPELQSITETDDYYDPDNQTFSGSSDRDIGPVSHEGGLFVEDYRYEGSGTFTVEFQSDGSEYRRRGISRSEPGSGVSVDLLPEGQYELSVTADASWELTLARPEAPASATVAPPATASGSGFDLVGPMTDTASVEVVASRDSTGGFQVTLIPEDVISGPDPLLLANTTDAVSDERFAPPVAWEYDGVVWAWVTTNGGWDLRFE
jgi:hypothetical protein